MNNDGCDECGDFAATYRLEQLGSGEPCSYSGLFTNPTDTCGASGDYASAKIKINASITAGVNVEIYLYFADSGGIEGDLVASWQVSLGSSPIDCDFDSLNVPPNSTGACDPVTPDNDAIVNAIP